MKVLIAEDDVFYRSMLEHMLKEWGYDLEVADNGITAWEHLRGVHAPKIAILDWMMPGYTGLELCRKVRGLQKPEPTYLIIVTSKQTKEDKIFGLESGADDFVSKPFDADELRARLEVGRRVVGLQTSQAVVYAFARAVDAKSPYTMGHSERVTAHALSLGSRLGLSDIELDRLRRGAILHDIGKISIPDGILNKPGPLTKEEFEIVKRHPLDGVAIIEPLESVQDLLPLIRWHHERMDGNGYPDGLPGSEIPLLVRALSVADVYDALASERPYRKALGYEECIQIIQKSGAEGGLDPELVRVFCTIPREELERDRRGIPAGAAPSVITPDTAEPSLLVDSPAYPLS